MCCGEYYSSPDHRPHCLRCVVHYVCRCTSLRWCRWRSFRWFVAFRIMEPCMRQVRKTSKRSRRITRGIVQTYGAWKNTQVISAPIPRDPSVHSGHTFFTFSVDGRTWTGRTWTDQADGMDVDGHGRMGRTWTWADGTDVDGSGRTRRTTTVDGRDNRGRTARTCTDGTYGAISELLSFGAISDFFFSKPNVLQFTGNSHQLDIPIRRHGLIFSFTIPAESKFTECSKSCVHYAPMWLRSKWTELLESSVHLFQKKAILEWFRKKTLTWPRQLVGLIWVINIGGYMRNRYTCMERLHWKHIIIPSQTPYMHGIHALSTCMEYTHRIHT